MKILVIGDSCTDIFIYGSCDRVCPEAPVPVFQPLEKAINRGMAGNVANNIKALGCNCDIITNNSNIIKTRYVDLKTNQMIMRLDENDFVENSYSFNSQKLKNYDAIVISDYDKGFLNEEHINSISKAGCLTFLQTNKVLGNWCLNTNFIKINEIEYNKSRYLLDGLGIDIKNKLVVTLGSRGCKFQDKIYPIGEKIETKSLAGAGDTFLAGLVVEYIRSRDMDKALNYAQKCASKVIQKGGVVTL